MNTLMFPDDFLWGTATASYQVEGAAHEGGRSESIWDTFCRIPGAVYAGENGDTACDQYHHYKEDVALIAKLGFKSYRFSIAWPRILPNGAGAVNKEGVAYYRNLCAELRKHGIQACATLYHWDLPQVIQDKGGWAKRFIVEAFVEYAKVCFAELGDCVDQWITINEPLCVTFMGYLTGMHAPGVKDPAQAASAVHHVLLAHGAAIREYRKTGLTAPIGITLNINTPRPATKRKADVEAACRAQAFEAEVFLFPLIGKEYPEIVLQAGWKFPVEPGDLAAIAEKMDFIGLNYYFENAVAWDENSPGKYSTVPFWQKRTDMGWPVVPQGLYRQIKFVSEATGGNLPIYITENGYANPDSVDEDGRVHDEKRIEYLKKHLSVCSTLIKEGVKLKGYFVWSFLDNFEWAWGYSKRFGILHVDYKTQKRTLKDSAYFFRDVMAGFGEW
ncbi:MAG: beta-glucosidase [Treponema sp.]|jgi:beta-glucosidase|nr:beta-glucosidase [Treponema sp.]